MKMKKRSWAKEKSLRKNPITRAFVWWRIEYPLPLYWKGKEIHGENVPEKERSKRIFFGIFSFGFVVLLISEDSIYQNRE
jgi:hypothetical protein